MNITLTLSLEEVNSVLQVLGQMPTASGAFPLFVKVKEQAETQMKPSEEVKE